MNPKTLLVGKNTGSEHLSDNIKFLS